MKPSVVQSTLGKVYAAVGRAVVLHAETMRVGAAPEFTELVLLLPADLLRSYSCAMS